MASSETVVVLGTGYFGLPAALFLARSGYRVIGVDIDENVVRALNDGVMFIDEAELEDEPYDRRHGFSCPRPGDSPGRPLRSRPAVHVRRRG